MTDTMRAWRTTGAGSPSEVLELRDDVPVPEPDAGSVGGAA